MSAFGFSISGWSIDRAVVEALGWTLVHFLWQGAVVAAALALLDLLLSRSRAHVRYVAGCAALLVMLGLPIVTFIGVRATTVHIPDPAGARLASSELTSPGRPATAFAAARQMSRRLLRSPRTIPAARTSAPAARPFAPSSLLPWFVALWAVGVGVLSLRLLGGWWMVMRLGRSAHNVTLEGWQESLNGLARRMGVSRPVRLVRSVLVTVPTAFGWLRPVILLPASTLTGLEPRQIEAILAHELAHIRRHDYLVNLLQSVIETLLFYHPAVWWVSHRIREERELCCDDLAVQASGDAVLYARALCEIERMRGEDVRMALAVSGGSLVDRIARLMGAAPRAQLAATRGVAWVLIALLVTIAGAAVGAVRTNDRPVRAHTHAHSPRPARPARLAPRAVAAQAAQAATAAKTAAANAVSFVQQAVDAVQEAAAVVAPAVAPVMAAASIPAEVACDTPAPDEQEAASDEDAPEPDAPESGVSELRAASRRFSAEDWQRLSNAGVSPRYVANLARVGYESLSVDELIALANHGVMSSYAGKMRRLLEDPSVDDLVRLASSGVTSAYAAAMRRQVGELSVEDLVRLANSGISTEYVAGMRELGVDDLTTEDLIRLANSGVTLEWFASLRWMGYEDLSVERAIELRNAGVTPDYAASLRMLQRHRLSLEELRTLRNQGVDVEYAATLMGLLRKDLDVEQLIRLRNQGVTVEFIAAMNALGYSNLDCDELILLRQQGVEPEFVAALATVGYGKLDAHDLARLRQSGVDADFVQDVREAGHGTPDVSDLIRMRQNGIPPSRLLP